MLNSFTAKQFHYWLNAMDITYEEAARLLGVDVLKIEQYAFGICKIPDKHADQCKLLLKLESQRISQASGNSETGRF